MELRDEFGRSELALQLTAGNVDISVVTTYYLEKKPMTDGSNASAAGVDSLGFFFRKQ